MVFVRINLKGGIVIYWNGDYCYKRSFKRGKLVLNVLSLINLLDNLSEDVGRTLGINIGVLGKDLG